MKEQLSKDKLVFVKSDGENRMFELQFDVDGKVVILQVSSEDHPEAAIYDDYFDSEENVKQAIEDGIIIGDE
ncbi:hypothetical protein ACTQ54_03990 [Fundicoccus sp. Sow4_H7]|uniref:hypothetical protein n=1 Tax=Fundicoccus sp. Sow4_H7 TaxID=3438784 RepID=UPI003F9002B5